jgi:hypothetical protein
MRAHGHHLKQVIQPIAMPEPRTIPEGAKIGRQQKEEEEPSKHSNYYTQSRSRQSPAFTYPLHSNYRV